MSDRNYSNKGQRTSPNLRNICIFLSAIQCATKSLTPMNNILVTYGAL